MTRKVLTSLGFLVWTVACLMVYPLSASAEWFGGVYGGIAFSESTTVQFDQRIHSSAKATKKLDLAASPTGGVRVGYWFGNPSGESKWFRSSIMGLRGMYPISNEPGREPNWMSCRFRSCSCSGHRS